MLVGVVALQGGFGAHIDALGRIGLEAIAVRYPNELAGLDGLVMPGGESSTQLRLMASLGMDEAVVRFAASGRPILATCAGLILCATNVWPTQRSLAILDIDVRRNAYGTQLDSFVATADDVSVGTTSGGGPLSMVFIRAPRITRVGSVVSVVRTLQGEPVLVRQGNVTGATFHPEWVPDPLAAPGRTKRVSQTDELLRWVFAAGVRATCSPSSAAEATTP